VWTVSSNKSLVFETSGVYSLACLHDDGRSFVTYYNVLQFSLLSRNSIVQEH